MDAKLAKFLSETTNSNAKAWEQNCVIYLVDLTKIPL